MTDLKPRIDLWRTPATRVAVAGGRNSRLAEETERELRSARQVELIQRPLLEADGTVAREVAESDVLISGGAKLDDAVFNQLKRVRFVLRPYVGYDDIDVDAATRHGILFANVPDTFIEEVANQTMAFVLATNRKVRDMDVYVREGKWSAGGRARDAARPIQRVSALTLGFVGFGNIARLVLERARPFGFRFLAADPYVSADAAAAVGVELVSLEELMRQSDIVSVHVFLNAETRGLINAERLRLMKSTAYLVNTSRGPVIDEAALIETLRARRIAGAALDVFEIEPVAADNPLLNMDNVLLSPHIASYSEEGDARHQIRIAEIALGVVNGGMPERKVVVNKGLYDELAAQLEPARAR
ncbi:MAG: C-terminal binding protein [Chloroflexi bacterium]|nr:C-terminal binding protein [Chloroflexota bacterium]MBV9546553.1 C-terminal binding protein [Chloroflexota bacterium]